MNSVTKPRCAISAASNLPPLSGSHLSPPPPHISIASFLLFFQTQPPPRPPFSFLSVRKAAGTSTKSSLFHTWTRDTRDHPVLGTQGVRAQLRHELAGLGAGATFYKAEGSLHASRVLHPGLVSQPNTNTSLLSTQKTLTRFRYLCPTAPIARRQRGCLTPTQRWWW